jgi:sodium/hydrogen exchanger 1 (Na(+)/H(+) exchanger 1) (NHE-1) (solute carrier family 9 member 1) (Na(+)/H(+) antiporter, amiloride- sensitive) (APNH).
MVEYTQTQYYVALNDEFTIIILNTDAVVITMYNTLTTFATEADIPFSEICMGFLGFLTVCGGGLFLGLFFGAISSLATCYTNGTRGRYQSLLY